MAKIKKRQPSQKKIHKN